MRFERKVWHSSREKWRCTHPSRYECAWCAVELMNYLSFLHDWRSRTGHSVSYYYTATCDMKEKCGIAAERNGDALIHPSRYECAWCAVELMNYPSFLHDWRSRTGHSVSFQYTGTCDMKEKCCIAAERNRDALIHLDMNVHGLLQS